MGWVVNNFSGQYVDASCTSGKREAHLSPRYVSQLVQSGMMGVETHTFHKYRFQPLPVDPIFQVRAVNT